MPQLARLKPIIINILLMDRLVVSDFWFGKLRAKMFLGSRFSLASCPRLISFDSVGFKFNEMTLL